ncbi:ABC transporter ATP-binding protein [Pontiellaceae bacterium B12227]|nr:ABC transporter ATP-binding protein [Pontiellaceae bacterium B12227]
MPIVEKLKLILKVLNPRDKRQLMIISAISVVNGLLGVAGIASVLPFIGLISEPELMHTNRIYIMFSDLTGIETYAGMVIAFGSISLLLIVFGNALSAFESWYGELFGARKDHELSGRLLENWLHTDVIEFEKKKNSECAKEILSDVDRILINTLFSMLDLISETITAIFIIALLLWVNWGVTLAVFVLLLVVHLLIHSITSRSLTRLGDDYTQLESSVFGHVLDALKMHKEIKLNDISRLFVERFYDSSGRLVRNSIRRSLINDLPNRLFEVVAVGTVLLIAIYFTIFSDSNAAPMTLIGMYAFSAYRLMPAIASVFGNLEDIWFDSANLEKLVGSLMAPVADSDPQTAGEHLFTRSIGLSGVDFSFSEHGPFHLDSLSLEIPANQMTCIKGRTGCGKSTVLYLLSGLYRPFAGSILLDGREFKAYGNQAWKNHVGFVPAVVNVLDSSMYENIALGVFPEEIDRNRVREVAELVDLHEHISGLKGGYDSVYGEDGLSFSSGQIQKVGLARALYRKPALLLLDESTDAFDLETENTVLSRLTKIAGTTIVFVSHRPSVFEHAHKIIDLEEKLV